MSNITKQLKNLHSREEIEAWVKKLIVDDTVELFYTIALDPKPFEGIMEPLIAGASPLSFLAMIAIGDEKLLELFKPYQEMELFQHQLMLAGNYLKEGIGSLEQAAEDLVASSVADENESLYTFRKKVATLKSHAESLNNTIKHFLEVVWGMKRPDLVEAFSHFKEEMLRLIQYIDHLDEKFNLARNEIFKAPDQAAPIEALADLGWYYPKDLEELASRLGAKDLKAPDAITGFLNDYFTKINLTNVKAFKTAGINRKKLLLNHLSIR